VVSGGNIGLGAVAGGTRELIGAVIGKALMDNPNLTQEERNALGQWAAVLVGAAVGGNQGAATALDAETFNRQLHLDEARLIGANAARYAVQQGYCTSVNDCSSAAIELAIGELTNQALKQVDISQADLPQNDAASAFLDSIAPKGSIPGLCNVGSTACSQVYFHASGDIYRDTSINAEFFPKIVEFYNLASSVYNSEHLTQIDIADSLFRQAEIIGGLHSANTRIDQEMLPWDIFNGIFAGIGGPFAIKQRVAERGTRAM
jgi:filamentous hemagglutinin